MPDFWAMQRVFHVEHIASFRTFVRVFHVEHIESL